jgi:hypothetical protein
MPVAGKQWHGRLWPVGLGHEMSVFEVKPKRGDMLEICFLAAMRVIPPDEGH